MPNKQKPKKKRNPLHDHPLMRKSAVHEKTNKAKRKQEKQKLQRQWRCLWHPLMTFLQVLLKDASGNTTNNAI